VSAASVILARLTAVILRRGRRMSTRTICCDAACRTTLCVFLGRVGRIASRCCMGFAPRFFWWAAGYSSDLRP